MNVFICITLILILAFVVGIYFNIIKISDDIENFTDAMNNTKANLEDIKNFVNIDIIDVLKKNLNRLDGIKEVINEYGKVINGLSNWYDEDREINAIARSNIARTVTDIEDIKEKFNTLCNVVNSTNEYVKHDNVDAIKSIGQNLADISFKIESMSKQINEFADKKKPATKLKTASKKDNYKNDGTDIVEQ